MGSTLGVPHLCQLHIGVPHWGSTFGTSDTSVQDNCWKTDWGIHIERKQADWLHIKDSILGVSTKNPVQYSTLRVPRHYGYLVEVNTLRIVKVCVTMNAWLPQASYPCGNCSDYSSWIFLRPQGSIGHVFRVIRSLRLLMLLSEYIQGILIPISNCKLLLGTVYNRLTGRLTGNRFIWTGKRNRTEPNRTGVILIPIL